ncbi:hypothetical protein D4R87_02710, partial [bacterium]
MLNKSSKKLRKCSAVFLSLTTLMWSMGVALSALVLLVSAKPVLAAAPTVMFVEIEPGTGSQSVRIGFSVEVDETTAETTTNYVLYLGETPYAANLATKSTANVVVDFSTALDSAVITPGTDGSTINISGVKVGEDTMTAVTGHGIFAEMDTDGGFYGPDVVINEVVVTPKSDWNDTTEGGDTKFDITHGTATPDEADEYIELRINTAGLDLSKDGGYYLEIYDTSYATGLIDGGGSGSGSNLGEWHTSENTTGIFDTVRYVGSGSVSSTVAGSFLVLGGLKGANLGENTHIALYRGSSEFVNMVSLGTFDDGYASDNATTVTSADAAHESNGRDNYGTDMGWNMGDFNFQAGSPGTENTYDPPLQLFGAFPFDATHVGLDFNEPPKSSTIIPANFTITKTSDSSTIAVSSAFVEAMGGGRFVKLTLASALAGSSEYSVAVGAGVTDSNDGAILAADRTRYFTGFSVDTTPPEITGINQPEATRIETYFSDENGVDISGAIITVTPTINVFSSWSSWDMVSLDLASQPVAGTTYTVTFTGVKDWPPPGGGTNTLVTNNTITFTGRDFATMDDGQPPYVMGTMPMDWSSEVARNIEKIQVGFSENMDASTIIATNAIELYEYTMSSGARGSEVTDATVAYDADLNAAIMTLTGSDLAANATYEIVVDSLVADQAGSTIGYDFSSFFITAGSTDTTPPYIFGTSVDGYWDDAKYNDVPVGEGIISVFFDSPLDPATVIDSNASDNGSHIMLSTTSAGETTYTYGEIEYDNYGWIADFKISSVLSANTDYTLTVTTDITDSAGNELPTEFIRRFTTAGTDSVAPTIQFADSDGTFVFIKFSEPLQQAQATNLTNYTLYSDAADDPITEITDMSSTAVAEYFAFDDAVEIRGLSLTPGNNFKIVVSGTIQDQSGNAIIANSSSTGEIFTMGQWQEELYIWDHYPYWGQNDVPTNVAALTAKFSDPLNSVSVSDSTVRLYDSSDELVTGTVSYKSDTNTVKFAPTSALSATSQYRWKLGTDIPANSISDINGNLLSFPFMVEFFTAAGIDEDAPEISSITPAQGTSSIATGLQMVEIFFDEAMDPSTINSGTIILATDADTAATHILGTIDYDPYGWRAEFRPSTVLTASTVHTVRVTTGVKDAAGVAFASAVNTTFTTAAADTVSPEVSWADADPWGLFVRFNEPVKEDLATATRNYTLITCASGSDLDEVGIVKSLTDKNINYNFWDNGIFIENLNLTAGTKFRVTVANVKDLSGNSINITPDTDSATVFRRIEGVDLTHNQWEGTVFDPTFQDSSPWTTYNYPMMGDRNAPLNLQRVEVGFSEAIAISTL